MKFKAKSDAIMAGIEIYARHSGYGAEHNAFWADPTHANQLALFVKTEASQHTTNEDRRVRWAYDYYHELANSGYESEAYFTAMVTELRELNAFRFPKPKSVGYWNEWIADKLRNMRDPHNRVTSLVKVLFRRNWFRREVDRSNGMTHPSIMQAWQLCSPVDEVQLVMEWPHMAKDGFSIAYTRDERYGEADRQTVTGVAKYLTRHFPGLSSNLIRDISAKYAPGVVKEVSTMAEMLQAIINGPGSCMGGKDNEHWDDLDSHHPYEVYDPALGWSMILYKEGSQVTGRALVNDKDWVRTYRKDTGSYSQRDERLEAWLSDNGYRRVNSWEGFKLKYIVASNSCGFVAPYLDGSPRAVEICGPASNRWLEVDADGEWECDNQNGNATEVNGRQCEDCGDRTSEDDGHWVGRNEDVLVCAHCCNDNYTYAYGRGGDQYYVNNNDTIECNGNYYDDSWLEDNGIVRTYDGEYYSEVDVVEVSGEYYPSESDLVCYTHDGDWELREDCVELENGEWCLQDQAWQCEHSGDWYDCDTTDSVTTKCGKIVHEDYADEYAEDDEETGRNEPAESETVTTTTI